MFGAMGLIGVYGRGPGFGSLIGYGFQSRQKVGFATASRQIQSGLCTQVQHDSGRRLIQKQPALPTPKSSPHFY
jgi:hypothetical protein